MDSTTITRKCVAAHDRFRRMASLAQSPLLLVVRFYWGWQFAQAGWGKLHNLAHVAGFFTSLGIPLPGLMAPFIAGLEFVGGLLLMLGLASRLTALVLAGDMVVAFLAADREALLSVFSDPGKFYSATPYTFLFACLLVLVFGPGRFALDAWIARHYDSTHPEHESGQGRVPPATHRDAA